MRIAIVAAELNDLDIMVGDVSSAYLEAYSQEKVCFIAGPEFGPLEGHLLVLVRALYGVGMTAMLTSWDSIPVRQTQMCGWQIAVHTMSMSLYMSILCSLARNLKRSLIR